jgi:hypothetical protein
MRAATRRGRAGPGPARGCWHRGEERPLLRGEGRAAPLRGRGAENGPLLSADTGDAERSGLGGVTVEPGLHITARVAASKRAQSSSQGACPEDEGPRPCLAPPPARGPGRVTKGIREPRREGGRNLVTLLRLGLVARAPVPARPASTWPPSRASHGLDAPTALTLLSHCPDAAAV